VPTTTWLLLTRFVSNGMREYLKTHHADLIETIEAKKELSKDVDAQLKAAIESFKKSGAY
jgi:F-type H+-transporting ATPase subunit alpha